MELCQAAKKYNIGVLIDAEEARRLEASLIVLERVFLINLLIIGKDWG